MSRYPRPFALVLLLGLGGACKVDRAPPRVSRAADAGAPAQPRTATPIVDATHGQLFGAVRDGEWLRADRAAAFTEKGTTYRLYTLDRFLGEAVGHAAAPPRETCDNPTVVLEGVPPATEDVIAIAGSWDALRRVPRRQEPKQPLYQESVAAWLRARGIDEPEVNVTQLLRVDLEGDGVEEVLLAANRMVGLGTFARAGDYGLVLLRKVVEGEVVTLPIAEQYFPEECVAECAPTEYRISAVLDVDGDGSLELVIGSRYFEGEGKSIYSVEGREIRERLSWSCGV